MGFRGPSARADSLVGCSSEMGISRQLTAPLRDESTCKREIPLVPKFWPSPTTHCDSQYHPMHRKPSLCSSPVRSSLPFEVPSRHRARYTLDVAQWLPCSFSD